MTILLNELLNVTLSLSKCGSTFY